MALTATANQEVVDDSIKIMKMKNPYLHKQSFNRKNLQYTIRKKDSSKQLIKDISQIIQERKHQTGIIYCLSKKDTESVCEALQLGIIH